MPKGVSSNKGFKNKQSRENKMHYALKHNMKMSLTVNYFKHVPSVFVKFMIKYLLLTIKSMGARSNDEVFESYS